MQPADNRERMLFREALQRGMGPKREAFLDGACAGDHVLRSRLGALLQAHESHEPFLEPVVEGLPSQGLPPPLPDIALECPGDLIGRYKLVEQIGEGGFGVVYLAHQTEPVQRNVAVKIIKAGMDTTGKGQSGRRVSP